MSNDQLDRRRERSAAAHAAAEKARTALTRLDSRLHTNAESTRQHTQSLRNAEAETKRLKRALKAQKQEKDRLGKARRKAAARADKAQARARALEEKYGRSVLADLVRREKERDRAAATGDATPTGRADPPPEQPDPAIAVATRTAARRTARRSA